MALLRGDFTRLAVSMPPRHGKSCFVSQYFPTWYLGRNPEARVIVCSYGRELAKQWSLAARDLFATYAPQVFGVDTQARASVVDWPVFRDRKRTGGGYYAVGKGGALTGKGCDLLILDDLIKDAAEANSASQRRHCWEWLQSVPLTRLEPGGRVLFVSTRWHHDDPIARLEAQAGAGGEPWRFVNLPAVAGDDDPLGRAPGAPLWPERYDLAALDRLRHDVGPRVWESLFCGRPTPLDGSVFRSGWLRPYKRIRGDLVAQDHRVSLDRLRLFATVDLAGSRKTSADYTAAAVFGIDVDGRTLWLLDLVRERVEAPDIIRMLRRLHEKHHLRVLYVEDTGPTLNLIHALALADRAGRKLSNRDAVPRNILLSEAVDAGLPVRTIKPLGDKVMRSSQAQAVFASGRLMTPREAPWLQAYLAELLQFPESPHDDMVDVTSYGASVFLETLAADAARVSTAPTFDRVGPVW